MHNIRKYRRISVGPEYTAGFCLNGVELKRIPLANLSAGGCFALLPKALASNVRRGYLLMDFILEHEDLAGTPFCSRVVHVVQDLPQLSESEVGMGISFLSTSPHFYEWLDAYISVHASQPHE